MNTLATADDQGGGSGVLVLGQLNRVAEHRCGNVQTVPAVSTYCAPNPSPGDRRTPLILLAMESWSQFGPWNWDCVHRWMCVCIMYKIGEDMLVWAFWRYPLKANFIFKHLSWRVPACVWTRFGCFLLAFFFYILQFWNPLPCIKPSCQRSSKLIVRQHCCHIHTHTRMHPVLLQGRSWRFKAFL